MNTVVRPAGRPLPSAVGRKWCVDSKKKKTLFGSFISYGSRDIAWDKYVPTGCKEKSFKKWGEATIMFFGFLFDAQTNTMRKRTDTYNLQKAEILKMSARKLSNQLDSLNWLLGIWTLYAHLLVEEARSRRAFEMLWLSSFTPDKQIKGKNCSRWNGILWLQNVSMVSIKEVKWADTKG